MFHPSCTLRALWEDSFPLPSSEQRWGGSAGCCLPLPNTSGALYEDSFLCAEHHPSAGCTPCRPRCLSPARLSIAPRGGSPAAPRPHVNKRGAAGADWLRRTAAAPPSARTGAGGEGLQPGVLPVLPLCPFARRAFRSVGSTMTVARLDQGQRYRPRMAFLKKVRAELLRVTGSAALGVSTGGTDRARADGAVRCGAPGRGPRVRISRSSILPGAAPRAPGSCCSAGTVPSPGICRVATWSPRHRGFGWWLRGGVLQKSRGESCNFKVIYIIISLAELFGRFSSLSYLFPPSSLQPSRSLGENSSSAPGCPVLLRAVARAALRCIPTHSAALCFMSVCHGQLLLPASFHVFRDERICDHKQLKEWEDACLRFWM